MHNVNRRSILKSSVATIAAVSLPVGVNAQSASYKPEDLKTTLTPFGAIKAGNADGTIPAWTGGYSTVPANYRQGDPRLVPFADEKPLFSITSANAGQYKDKLSSGMATLLQRYPDFRIDIYETHRTAIAPQYVYDCTYQNATTAQLSADGNSVIGAYGGLPFPIPKNGHEVMWNHELSWAGTTAYLQSDAYAITADGQVVFESRVNAWYQFPYYFENGKSQFQGIYFDAYILPIAPPYEAGAGILELKPVNPMVTPVEAWEYLEGQRRVRRAPELQYDTPNSLAGGVTNWDEANIFAGQLNEYDFNLIEKKELYIPYNMNKAWAATTAEQLGPHFLNPEISRWELHRVWVVEMTLKPGSRNVDSRRTVYFDEDTGCAVLCDVYDASGSLWKVMHNMPAILPDVPAIIANNAFITYDLHSGDYAAVDIPNAETQPQYKIIPKLATSFFTAGQLAASAGGF